jgi:hypothetical protein
MAWINEKARFKAWILGTNGETCVQRSLPYRSEITELAKLKNMIATWKRYNVHLTIFYDLTSTNDQGEPKEIGRYQNQRFEGI